MKFQALPAALAASMLLTAAPMVISATSFALPAEADTVNLPLNKVVGTKAVDQSNNTVGDVVGAVVSEDGSIKSLIVNIGSWISGKKDIQIQYSGVTQNKDGNFVVPITKDQAKAMAAYSYSDPSLRGKLLGENGSVYTSPSTNMAAMNAGTMNSTTTTANASIEHDSVVNSDGSFNSSKVVGLTVQNSNKDSIGKIDELLIGKRGQISGVIVDVGGFLGMGARPVKLDWKQVKLVEQDGSTIAMVDASKDSLKAMPEYKTQ